MNSNHSNQFNHFDSTINFYPKTAQNMALNMMILTIDKNHTMCGVRLESR